MAAPIFKNKTFVKLFFASFTSQLGTTVGNMAFAFYLLDHFSSQPAYATLAELMYSLPTLFVFSFVGVFADRFDRKKIAAWCDWIRACLSILLLLSIWINILPITFIILFMRSAISKFFAPSELAILQGILDKDQYVRASGLNETLFGTFMLFGVGLGAVAYQTIGIHGAMMLDIISFLISGALISMASISENVRLPNGKTDWTELRIPMVLKDFKDGFSYILNNKLLLTIISGFFIFGFINGGFAILPIFSMKYHLSPGQYQLYASYFAIALGLGFLIGSALGTILIKHTSKHFIIICGIMIASILTFFLGIASQVWIYLFLILLTGITLAPVNIAIGGWLPELVDPKLMGRVSAWIDPLMMTAQSIALGLIAVLFPAFINLKTAYLFMAAGLFAVFIFYLVSLPRLAVKTKSNSAEIST
jgi:MFS family permease